MTLSIRPATTADEAPVYHICLVTSNAGKDGTHLQSHPDIPGTVYAVPWLYLDNSWGFVLVDQVEGSEENVVGYVVGSPDVHAFEKEAEEKWWPEARKKFAAPTQQEQDDNVYSGAEVYYRNFIHKPLLTGQDVVDAGGPAYIHINILPAYQRQGWGKQLIKTAAEKIKSAGPVAGGKGNQLWVGLDSRNDEGRKFYKKLGFQGFASKEGEYYVLDLDQFLSQF